MKALAKAIKRHLAECNGQEIANIAWAFAKSGYFDEGMFAHLAEMAEKQMDRFNSQEITNIFWAFATAECHNANFLRHWQELLSVSYIISTRRDYQTRRGH